MAPWAGNPAAFRFSGFAAASSRAAKAADGGFGANAATPSFGLRGFGDTLARRRLT
jgi:hypothetical protein